MTIEIFNSVLFFNQNGSPCLFVYTGSLVWICVAIFVFLIFQMLMFFRDPADEISMVMDNA